MNSLTKQKNQTKTTLMVYYQGFLAVAATLLFFTRSDVYLYQKHGIGLPLYWFLAFLVLSFPLFISLLGRLNCVSKPIIVWCMGYLTITSISILIRSKVPDLQELEDLIRTIIFIILMLTIYSYQPIVFKWVKLTILLVTIVNVGLFVYEFFNPLAFYLEQRSPGRSSGFYDDSNTATIAVILGMILTIDFFKPKYRLFYALFIFLGTAPTFSRGGIVGWVFLVGLFILNGIIPRHQIPLLFLSFFFLISILSTQINNLSYLKSSDGTELFHEDTLDRVEFLINPFGQKDDSKAARLGYVQESWLKFVRSPFIGNGLGSGKSEIHRTPDGSTGERSHNIYLDGMVEFGFLGAFIYPLLLLASVWEAQGEFKKQALAFIIFMMIQGFFSHTLLSEFCSLTVYAIMGSFTKRSYVDSL